MKAFVILNGEKFDCTSCTIINYDKRKFNIFRQYVQ